jgi:hypothetical protein
MYYGEVEVHFKAFLIPVLHGSEWCHATATLNWEKSLPCPLNRWGVYFVIINATDSLLVCTPRASGCGRPVHAYYLQHNARYLNTTSAIHYYKREASIDHPSWRYEMHCAPCPPFPCSRYVLLPFKGNRIDKRNGYFKIVNVCIT